MKKIISCLILCAMLLAMIPMNVFANETESVEKTISVTDYKQATDKTAYPFSEWIITISDVDELELFNTWTGSNNSQEKGGFKTAHIRIENDIDYTGKTWSGMVFDGTIDGNGHTISNITVGTCTNAGGMFRYAGGTIKDLTVNGLTCEQTIAHVGGIVGSRANTNVNKSGLVIDNVHIINGYIKGTISVGGILGNANGYVDAAEDKNQTVTISNSSFNGSVTGTDNVGGMVGYGVNAGSLSVSNCSVSLEVGVGATSNIGSIIGQTKIPTTLSNCVVAPFDNNPANFVTATNVTVDTSTCSTAKTDTRYYGFQSKTVDGKVDYRIVGTLDAEELGAVNDIGFYVTLTYNGVTKVQKVSCHAVYTSVKGGKITYTTKQPTAEGETAVEGDYLFVLVIPGVPSGESVSAEFTPYMADSADRIICGSTQAVTLVEIED